MTKKFFEYVLPSMLAFAFSGLYTIVDGFFIGRNIGDTGLAAINIAFPLTAFIQAIGTGLGMGGAILLSICHGKKDLEQEKFYLGNTLLLLLASGGILTLLLSLLYRPLLTAMGAEGQVLNAASSYMHIIAMGTAFQIFATGLTPVLRNFSKALLAMGAMVCGFLTNILLDWLFVAYFQTGMAGAALATVIGQGVTILPCLLFLIKKTAQLKLHHYMISYVTSIILLLLQGISDGSQPLISLCLGQGLVFFLFGFLFAAFCRVTTSYFYATRKNVFAYIMVYGEPILLTLLLITCLPRIMGLYGVWMSAPSAQFLLALTGFLLVSMDRKRNETHFS